MLENRGTCGGQLECHGAWAIKDGRVWLPPLRGAFRILGRPCGAEFKGVRARAPLGGDKVIGTKPTDITDELLASMQAAAAIVRSEIEPARVYLPPDVPDACHSRAARR